MHVRYCPKRGRVRPFSWSHWALENSISCWIGIETTLGDPHAVEIRLLPNGVERICVITVLMTAATRPSQSNTGAPEAPWPISGGVPPSYVEQGPVAAPHALAS